MVPIGRPKCMLAPSLVNTANTPYRVLAGIPALLTLPLPETSPAHRLPLPHLPFLYNPAISAMFSCFVSLFLLSSSLLFLSCSPLMVWSILLAMFSLLLCSLPALDSSRCPWLYSLSYVQYKSFTQLYLGALMTSLYTIMTKLLWGEIHWLLFPLCNQIFGKK